MTEIRALTGIRGIAAIWVLLFHFGEGLSSLIPCFAFVKPIYEQGHIGVDLFFVLSGFIISYVYSSTSLWTNKQKMSFLVKRIAKIYPIHLVTLFVLATLVGAASIFGIKVSGNYSILDFFYNVLLLQGYPFGGISWNYPSWSISAEFFGYIFIFPLTLYVFRMRNTRRVGVLISVVVIALYAYLRSCNLFGVWDNLARITFGFSSGAALYYGLRERASMTTVLSKFLPLAIFIALAVCFFPSQYLLGFQPASILIILCPVIIGALSYDRGIICSILGSHHMRYLGLISYSLYMTHAIVQKIFKVVIPPSEFVDSFILTRITIFSAYLIIPILVAAIFYHFFEEPARIYLQRIAKRHGI